MTPPIITFTSDFGTREYYVGAVKGVILDICPQARVIDLSHDINSHDILEGAFTLACAYRYYPPRTIHLVVVDPGVGSARRGLAVRTARHFFVAPDNGILSLVWSRDPAEQVVSLETERFFHHPVSPTFHGRDIFGPAAAWLARGVAVEELGPVISDYVRLPAPAVEAVGPKRLQGMVLHVDKFGNIITNITPADVERELRHRPEHLSFQIGKWRVRKQVRFYSEGSEQEPFSLVGSSGYYEVALLQRPAAQVLGVRPGMKVWVEMEPAGKGPSH